MGPPDAMRWYEGKRRRGSREVNRPPQHHPPVRIDEELAATLRWIDGRVPTSLAPADIQQFRLATSAASPADEELMLEGHFDVTQHVAVGTNNAPDVPLLLCRPQGQGPQPLLLFLHGGGMVVGDARTGLLETLKYARSAGMAVASVTYRLAPEHPYPAALDDCQAALVWLHAHAERLGIDASRLVVAGSSAGGGLAAAMCLRIRDHGGPQIIAQLLMGPMLDDRNNSVSSAQMAGLGIWDRVANDTGWRAALGDAAGGVGVSPYAAPGRAEDLAGLPPTFIDVGSAETFRDECVAYASAIWAAGGDAELHVWPGAFHGYDLFDRDAALTQFTHRTRADWLGRILAKLAPTDENSDAEMRPHV